MPLDRLPRYRLATLPTPLDETPRLSRELGVRVLLKRDDLTGFALGGNKARILEYLLADAIDKHADMLVTGGGPQSNHARMTAAAARKAGMDCVLVLSGEPPATANGNLLLDQLLGAELVYTHSNEGKETDRLIDEVTRGYQAKGRRPYAIGRGGSSPQGVAAYMLAVRELLDQLNAVQVRTDSIFVATGSCGTHAGILAGVKFFGADIPVHGITVSRPRSEGMQRIAMLVKDAAEFLDIDLPLKPEDIIINDEYIGAGYAIITPEAREAIRRVAQLEGVFLDPVYTGKAMAGLIDWSASGPSRRAQRWCSGTRAGRPGCSGIRKISWNEGNCMTQRFANEGLLVSTEWLAQHLDDPDVRLVEVSTPGAGYTLGHIRNAVYFNLAEAFNSGSDGLTHMPAPTQELAAILGRKGIAPDRHVVICDENGGARAAQMFWLLEYLGFEQVSVLEGGVERWLAEGRPQTRKLPEIMPVQFKPQPRQELYADVNWMREHLKTGEVALIDCRSDEEYQQGHIPGARNRNWEQTLRLKAYQSFRPADELHAELSALGGGADKEVVTYCGTGLRSSHTYLTLRLLGYPRVRNYVGSWTEWSTRADLPRE